MTEMFFYTTHFKTRLGAIAASWSKAALGRTAILGVSIIVFDHTVPENWIYVRQKRLVSKSGVCRTFKTARSRFSFFLSVKKFWNRLA